MHPLKKKKSFYTQSHVFDFDLVFMYINIVGVGRKKGYLVHVCCIKVIKSQERFDGKCLEHKSSLFKKSGVFFSINI